jgi:hypothetical protein
VTTWQETDLAYVKAVFQCDVPSISAAGIFPTVEHLRLFSERYARSEAETRAVSSSMDADSISAHEASTHEGIDELTDNNNNNAEEYSDDRKGKPVPLRLAMLLDRFVELAKIDGRYFLCDHTETATIANWLHPVPLSIEER